jgi:uncharacterized protein YkwD
MELFGQLMKALQGDKNPFDPTREAEQAAQDLGKGGGGEPQGTSNAAGADKPSGGAGAQAPGQPPSSGQGGSFGKEMLDEINRVRQEHGLGPVSEAPGLDAAARKNDQANNASGQLGHHVGLLNGSHGEITAYASDGESAKKAVEQWLNSPGHRAILLDPNMTKVGVSIDGDYATADFS